MSNFALMVNDSSEHIDLDNREFQNVWNLVQHTRQSVFMTGKAGTGKSTFLKYITAHTRKRYVVLAPTGIAAVNVGGVTLHSFFRIPFKPLLPDDPDFAVRRLRERLKYPKEHAKLIKNLDLIIIDEISMVRADIIDFIDKVLRVYSGNMREPFGGKQLLLVGDIFQLEPVVTSDMRDLLAMHYPNPYFFSAHAFQNVRLIPIELRKIYRQRDDMFISLLDRVRMGRPTLDDLNRLRMCVNPAASCGVDDFVMTLAARRDMVDSINDEHLFRLKTPEIIYEGRIVDNFPENSLPTQKELTLKVGAQIVFVRNDRNKRWVNGTLGRVHTATPDRLEIELESGARHVVELEVWENVEYKYDEKSKRVIENVIGTFTQYPVRLAWALTVHKSQGLTFNKVIIDLGRGAFSSGQSYVALSRCTGLDGLTLKSPLSARDIFVNQSIVDFSRMFNDEKAVSDAIEYARVDEMFRQASIKFDNGDTSGAVDDFARALVRKNVLVMPSAVRLLKRKLSVIDTLNAENVRLKEELEECASRFRRLADEYVAMGKECIKSGHDNDAALANFEKALSISPDYVPALYNRAVARAGTGDLDNALIDLHRIMTVNKDDYDAAFMLGELYMQVDELHEALNWYLVALKNDSRQSAVYDRLADLYEHIGDEEEADRYRAAAKKLRPPRGRRKK